jgi:hypothetical protein
LNTSLTMYINITFYFPDFGGQHTVPRVDRTQLDPHCQRQHLGRAESGAQHHA